MNFQHRRILAPVTLWAVASLMACGARAQPAGGAEPASNSNPERHVPANPTTEAPRVDDLHAPFDELLRQYVRDQRVDYLTWRDQDGDKLDSYLAAMSAAKVENLPEADQLAFYVNLYNAAMIDTVLDRVDANYSPADSDFSVFDEQLVELDGKTVSLNHIEHEIVRKQFDDPRVHVALVCGARSCPPLLARAYRGSDLDSVLESNMKSFINSGERNKVGEKKLELSQIFEWFADDFGGADQIGSYVDRYVYVRDVSSLPITYVEYSWTLNLAAPSGEWMRVKATANGVEADALVEVLSTTEDRVTVRKPGGSATVELAKSNLASYEF